jgi:hypothetical protein
MFFATTIPELTKQLAEVENPELAIIDARDAPTLAQRAAILIRKTTSGHLQRLLIASSDPHDNTAEHERLVRANAEHFIGDVLGAAHVALIRKKGPRVAATREKKLSA